MENNSVILDPQNLAEAIKEIEKVKADSEGIKIMAPKSVFRVVKLEKVKIPAAQILKEEMLSIGGEAARARGAVSGSIDSTDVLLSGTLKHYKMLVKKLKAQPFGLKTLAKNLERILENYDKTPQPMDLNGKKLTFEKKTLIMGIINMTPDSFSGDGLGTDVKRAVMQALEFEQNGAGIIDVGAESTRPGAAPVTAEEEKKVLVPVIEALYKKTRLPISVDTYKSEVAEAALKAGASIVNDITGLKADPDMARIISENKCGCVLMHIKGTPANMQDNPAYDDVMSEIIGYLRESIQIAEDAGVDDSRIIIDPGIGFGKTAEHNFEILRRLKELKVLGKPVLVGTSRKSFIGNILGKEVGDRIFGTSASVAASILNGADIVRVHDVKEIADVVKITDRILGR